MRELVFGNGPVGGLCERDGLAAHAGAGLQFFGGVALLADCAHTARHARYRLFACELVGSPFLSPSAARRRTPAKRHSPTRLSKLRGYHLLCVTASGPHSYAGSKRARVTRPLSPPDSYKLPEPAPIFILHCGPKDHGSLVAQRYHRIDTQRTARGEIAG